MSNAQSFHVLHIDPYTQQTEQMLQWAGMMARIGTTFTLMCMRTDQAEWLLSRVGQIDLAYVDGDHELPGVAIDLQLVADRVRHGGLLAVHDYTHDYLRTVQLGVDKYMRSGAWEDVGVFGSLGVWRRR